MPQPDRAALRARLEARKGELDDEQSRLLAGLDQMEPAIARRALLRLADQVAELRRDFENLLEEEQRGSPG